MELRETYTYTSDSGREYRVLEKIANTVGANVFTTTSLNEENQPTRVLKQLKKDSEKFKFEEERRILTQLNQTNGGTGYPGVIKLYDSSEKNFFLILEYIKGGTLRGIIDKRDRLELPEGVAVIKSMSGTSADIFENEGIVHRDVKPENTLLSKSARNYLSNDHPESERGLEEIIQPGDLKLCDFAYSLRYNKATGEYESKVHDRIRTGYFVGSLQYCAPEIVKAERGYERSDVWALGVIAYELLVEGGAFLDVKSPREMYQAIATFDSPRKIERKLHGFEEVLYGMLQKNPDDRLTAREIYDASSDFEKKLREGTITEEPEQRVLNFVRRMFVRT